MKNKPTAVYFRLLPDKYLNISRTELTPYWSVKRKKVNGLMTVKVNAYNFLKKKVEYNAYTPVDYEQLNSPFAVSGVFSESSIVRFVLHPIISPVKDEAS